MPRAALLLLLPASVLFAQRPEVKPTTFKEVTYSITVESGTPEPKLVDWQKNVLTGLDQRLQAWLKAMNARARNRQPTKLGHWHLTVVQPYPQEKYNVWVSMHREGTEAGDLFFQHDLSHTHHARQNNLEPLIYEIFMAVLDSISDAAGYNRYTFVTEYSLPLKQP